MENRLTGARAEFDEEDEDEGSDLAEGVRKGG